MDAFRKQLNTRSGQTIAVVIDLILVYILASISIDTANMFAYAATIFFLGSAIVHIVNIVKFSQKPTVKAKQR